MARPEKMSDEELLRLAAELIAERGLAACTFRNLAERAGTSTRTFTYRFETRGNLLRQVLRLVVAEFWDGGRFELGTDDPLGTLIEAAYGGIQHENPPNPFYAVYDQVQVAAPFEPELVSTILELEREMVEKYCRLITEAQEAGQIPREISPEDLTAQIWALGDGLNIQRYIDPIDLGADRLKELFTSGVYRLANRPDLAE